MASRRFAQVSTSEEEDNPPTTRRRIRNSSRDDVQTPKKSKKLVLQEDDDDEVVERGENEADRGNVEDEKVEEKGEDEDEEEEDTILEDAKPIGEPIKVSGKGRGRRNYYKVFEYDGNRYELEDPILLAPEVKNQKPYVAIIKEITQTKAGSMMITGQWFYRPEEAEKKGGGNWQSCDTRELFYSFHRDEIPGESVMHKCVVHFVPVHKQLPIRKKDPGFIVQKVYDTVHRKLWKLTDKDYEDHLQHEIDLLVEKTLSRLVDLPDIENPDTPADQEEDKLKTKITTRRKNISPLDVTREEEPSTMRDQHARIETPGSCTNNTSEYHSILVKFNSLTGDSHRNNRLERLLRTLKYMCRSTDRMQVDEEGKNGSNRANLEKDNKLSSSVDESHEKGLKKEQPFRWPDDVVPAVTALEKASHDALYSDSLKYNQKMRQLVFNLKKSALLARRLLNGELEPSKILSMSPNELKEGLTSEEAPSKELDESERMQMTDARCSRCREIKVGLRDIIQAGHGDRYQLECIACGHSWYASRDEVSTLTIDGPNSTKDVGTAPLATAKFEQVEKNLVSPHESDKSANDVAKKASEACMPVLDSQKSVSRSKNEGNAESTKKSDQ